MCNQTYNIVFKEEKDGKYVYEARNDIGDCIELSCTSLSLSRALANKKRFILENK